MSKGKSAMLKFLLDLSSCFGSSDEALEAHLQMTGQCLEVLFPQTNLWYPKHGSLLETIALRPHAL